jgi:gluconate 2-dehydrogenase gamma chain
MPDSRRHQEMSGPPAGNAPGVAFFSPREAATFDAVAARIWPGTGDDPGAREARVTTYVDRALAGPYAGFQDVYRRGLEAIDTASLERHGAAFTDLTAEQQDALLADVEAGRAAGWLEAAGAAFFRLCITHTMEGVFCDPIHGGNRDFAGWRAVGYPGPQGGFEAEEQVSRRPLERPPRSVADPAARHTPPPSGATLQQTTEEGGTAW